jgi:hypothetical protein
MAIKRIDDVLGGSGVEHETAPSCEFETRSGFTHIANVPGNVHGLITFDDTLYVLSSEGVFEMTEGGPELVDPYCAESLLEPFKHPVDMTPSEWVALALKK